MSIGQMLRQWLTQIEYANLFFVSVEKYVFCSSDGSTHYFHEFPFQLKKIFSTNSMLMVPTKVTNTADSQGT